jgi:hypothetical protein
MKSAIHATFVFAALLATVSPTSAETNTVTFDKPVSTYEWTLKEINPDLPSDWTGYDFLVIEFRASSSQRFELALKMSPKSVSKRIHPYPGVWVRASIPLRYYRQGLGNGSDLAATVNQPRNAYWINIEAGGYYVEHTAAHPEVIGTHWFQWIDQPALGRNDGENYNIGWVDVTDRPYDELVEAAKLTHARLLDIHLGKIPPTNRMAKTSEIGTPAETRQLGVPAIQ